MKNKKKKTPNNRQRQVHLCLYKSLLAPTVYDIEKKGSMKEGGYIVPMAHSTHA